MPSHTAQESAYKTLVDTVLNTIIDGVIIINARGEIETYNNACEQLFGYAPHEVLGKNVKMLMPAPYRIEHDNYIENFRRTGVAKIIGIGREVTGQRKDGSVFPMELAVGATYLNDHNAYVGIIRDITERKEADKARDQLRQAQKMEAIGQLTGGIAHDFNNLLAVIIGNLDFISENLPPDAPLRRHVQPAIHAALHGAELTTQLLAFSRKQTLQPKRLDANQLITQFSTLLRRTIGERIDLYLALSPKVWPIFADPMQLENVLLNLAVNARDAMPDGGRIHIQTENALLDDAYASLHSDATPGPYVMIAISDTGCGMSPEILEKVFEPFFTTKEVGKGTGLGLSMVYGFVKQSEGHIKIYSEEGKGTTIRIYLPPTENMAVPELTIEPSAPAIPNCVRVLVVEDNPDVLRLTSAMVASLGYEVQTATNGEEAIALLRTNAFDILLSDVMLPGSLNGPAMAKQARELQPELRVMFNSGYAESILRESEVLDKNVIILSKPFRKPQLAQKLAELLAAPVVPWK